MANPHRICFSDVDNKQKGRRIRYIKHSLMLVKHLFFISKKKERNIFNNLCSRYYNQRSTYILFQTLMKSYYLKQAPNLYSSNNVYYVCRPAHLRNLNKESVFSGWDRTCAPLFRRNHCLNPACCTKQNFTFKQCIFFSIFNVVGTGSISAGE